MMRVPYDKKYAYMQDSTGEYMNEHVVLFEPYQREQWQIAYNRNKVQEVITIALFQYHPIGVETDTLPDFYLSSKPTNDDYIGVLRAMGPKTGEEVWRYENPAPLWGGVMATACDLVFTGTPESFLKAFDAKTGEELYKFNTGSGVVGTPVTWTMDGEQFVSVASGWGGAVPLWGGEVAKVIKDFNQDGMV
jgi:glucose dehydrogenase